MFNLCISLAQDLFYRADQVLQLDENPNASKNINNSKSDSNPAIKINKIK